MVIIMNGLKKLCVCVSIAIMLFLTALCVIGSVMGAGWTRSFFNSIAGGSLWVSLGLLFIAEILEFGNVKNVFSAVKKWFNWSKNDVIIAILLLLIIVFIFYSRIMSVSSHNLKSVFFVPHIFTCLLSYVFFVKAAYFSGKCLADKLSQAEDASYRLVCPGFMLLTVGMVLGSIWAASAWGNWWSWDPKESFSLAVWLVSAAFLQFRFIYGQRFLRLNSFWVIIVSLLIILGITFVNFSKIFAGLHNYRG